MRNGELASCAFVWSHEGAAADLVRRLKYGADPAVVTALADAMASRAPEVDLVTWCPASPTADRRRRFDHGELLARGVGHRLGVRVRRLLRRHPGDIAQTRRDIAGRMAGPRLVPAGRLRSAPRVLLIDDVTTSGTTLRAGAVVLGRMGAGSVHGLVATRAQRRAADTGRTGGVPSGTTPKHGGCLLYTSDAADE